MSKHVKTKTPYNPKTRNSLGQFLRSLERMIWTSAFIVREHVKEITNPKTKVVTQITVPASVHRPGLTYTNAEN